MSVRWPVLAQTDIPGASLERRKMVVSTELRPPALVGHLGQRTAMAARDHPLAEIAPVRTTLGDDPPIAVSLLEAALAWRCIDHFTTNWPNEQSRQRRTRRIRIAGNAIAPCPTPSRHLRRIDPRQADAAVGIGDVRTA